MSESFSDENSSHASLNTIVITLIVIGVVLLTMPSPLVMGHIPFELVGYNEFSPRRLVESFSTCNTEP